MAISNNESGSSVRTKINASLALTDAITASAAELNILDGATLTTTELNYVDGVTSAIQTQIDAKLSTSTAASTYLTQANAASTYLTIATAASTYVLQSSTIAVNRGGTGLTVLGTGLQVLRTNAGATAMEWATISAGGGDLLASNNLSDLTNFATARTNLGLAIGTNVQAFSSNLTSFATVTPSANGLSLVSAANYAAMVTLLGLTIGTNTQAYNANLTTYAGIAPSANVQTLLGAANYAAFKTSLSLNLVENTALSTWAGTTNITTLGTIATGTWNATAITAVKGGTGQTSYAVGDILYASTTTALSKLAVGTDGQVLTLAGGVPTWANAGSGSGDMLLAGSQTITGYFDNSYTSVVSRPALHYTGSTYTGGTATNTKPHILIEPSGTTSTNWQTTGTYFGINGVSGYTGYLIDAQINAVQKFAVSKDGIIVGVGSTSLPSIRFTGWSANNGIYSNADGQIGITNSGTQTWVIAGFAISANSTRGPYLRQGTPTASTATYAFNGDTNTGMWSSGADTIDFTTSGTNRVSMVNTRTIFIHRLNTTKGADVASANDLTLGTDGNVFIITGTTTINAILTTNWDAGAEVVLIFSGATTVKHNTAGGASTARIFLSGSVDLTTAANTILCLVYDGTQWQETSKKAA